MITSSLPRTLTMSALLLALIAGLIFAMAAPARAERDGHDENDNKKNEQAHMTSMMQKESRDDHNDNKKEDKEFKEFSREFISDQATNTPATVLINAAGKIKLTAVEVTESNWPNLKVKAWGNVFSVHVMPDARIIGATNTGSTTPLVTVAVGEKVDILGDVEASGLMHATSFRNRSTAHKQTTEIQSRIKGLLEEIEKLRSQLNDLRKNVTGALGNAFGH